METLKVIRVQSVDELRGISPDDARHIEAILWPSKRRYIFNPGSTAADDGVLVLQPTNVSCACCSGSGRWEAEDSASATKVARVDFSGGVGDYIVPTGFVPKLVIVSAVVQWDPAVGATSFGIATGVKPGEQSVITNAEADGSSHTQKYRSVDSIIVLSSPVGVFGTTAAVVTQMDSTQVKITMSAGSADFTVTVIG